MRLLHTLSIRLQWGYVGDQGENLCWLLNFHIGGGVHFGFGSSPLLLPWGFQGFFSGCVCLYLTCGI